MLITTLILPSLNSGKQEIRKNIAYVKELIFGFMHMIDFGFNGY